MSNLRSSSTPLIVAGMHRSGTSLMTAVVGALGVDLGDRLLDGDIHNAKGYFEDVDFLEFQRKVLQSRSPVNDLGWPDWGWTESETINLSHLEEYVPEAQSLIEVRQNRELWGWKDPRTTLLLDFWAELLPNARYLLVYRFPWDVADSVLRVNHPTFVANPDYALRSWYFYNRALLKFYCDHRDQSVLINVNEFLNHPQLGIDLLVSKLGLAQRNSNEQSLSKIYDPQLFTTLGWDYPLVRSLYQVAPRYFALLKAMDQEADLASPCPDWVTVSPSVTYQAPDFGGAVPSERSILALHACIIQNNLRHQEILNQLQSETSQLQRQISSIEQSKSWQLYQSWKRLKAKLV